MTAPTVKVHISDPLGGRRVAEPVEFSVVGDFPEALWLARTNTQDQVVCQRLTHGSGQGSTRFVVVLTFVGETTLAFERPLDRAPDGIVVRQDPQESDAFARLDTGYFDLELCRGTAKGTGASKWGIRHFRTLDENIDLLPSGNNAIGGFYGPFFTPENGLINPPEHTAVEIATIEEGPVARYYRMRGTIPDGLLPELRGKDFAVDWRFTHRTPYFTRRYTIDDFTTVINGRSVTNKITVGDEFEGGQGTLVFDRFAAYGGTRYRAGDPYAEQLADMVEQTIVESTTTTPTFTAFRRQLTGDMTSAHWDLYWRLFCTWEQALDDDEIRARLSRVRAAAHVLADHPDRPWILTDEPVDVSATQHQTIFPGPASKTVEYHTKLDRAMIWWTSEPSGAFQIVQRPQSGWVNWGSNGENECPELPVGVEIKTAYGPFAASWESVADGLERPLVVDVK